MRIFWKSFVQLNPCWQVFRSLNDLSKVEDTLSHSDLEGQQSENSHFSKSSTPIPNATTQNGRVEESFTSTLVELYIIQSELRDILF